MDDVFRQSQDLKRIILHIDFDSFFASVEQQYNPKLRNRPIGVTAQNGRTCIIASSREAKRLGIKTGNRSYEALKICPSLILVKADFLKYFEVTKKFINICKDYSPYVELFSIDEVFMDVRETLHLFGGIYQIVQKIKRRIKNEIGEYITVSFGISYNKLLAKLASGINKPDGIFEIDKNNFEEVYSKAKLTDICGIGERIKNHLNRIGVRNLFDLRKISYSILLAEFGNTKAEFLKQVAFGVDESPIIPYTQAPKVKSISRNYCFIRNEYNKRKVFQNIYELCEEIGIKLRRLNKKARTIGISLRGSFNFSSRKTYENYIDCGKEIFDLCKNLLNRESPYQPRQGDSRDSLTKNYVRMISIWVSNLEDSNNLTLSLFKKDCKSDKLLSIVDEINDRFGDHTIRNGFLLYADKLTTVPNGYMADKYERTRLAGTADKV